MTEQVKRNNLWAPWRMKYIRALAEDKGCFLCRYAETEAGDEDNFVLFRTAFSIAVLNRFPYNNGHLLVAPKKHIADFEQADDEQLLDMIKLVHSCQKALSEAIRPHGFNIGMNFGRCAGAGLPDHLHIHVVPRWDGDTNCMHVCGDTDVISQSLTELYRLLKEVSSRYNLPGF